tara:strand:- start:30030 stop:31208 length:1179 start_codon:yes stop_codon:yes gene_type:complete
MPHPPLISDRAQSLQPSLTLAISAKAKNLSSKGKDICSLSAGEPDFQTPNFIVEAAIKALKDGFTRYGPAAGDPALRQAVAEKLNTKNKIKCNQENILITNGGKQAIYNLFQVLLNPGDEVIIPSPYWLSYPEIAKLAGAKPILVKTSSENGFEIDIKELHSNINKKTRMIIINSPSNPTGNVLSKEVLESLAEILRKNKDVYIMSDEIYEYIIEKDVKHYSLASLAPDISDRIITVNGFAKAWAMTGWRIGYLCAHNEIVKAATALQSQSTSNVCSFSQRGALAALLGPEDCIVEMAQKYNIRRKILFEGLKSIPGFELKYPKGAFYTFPRLPSKVANSMVFCDQALEQVGLAIVPGIAFGEDRFIRLSCAVSSENIQEGIRRLKRFIDII